jgi:hypothetical protein
MPRAGGAREWLQAHVTIDSGGHGDAQRNQIGGIEPEAHNRLPSFVDGVVLLGTNPARGDCRRAQEPPWQRTAAGVKGISAELAADI